MTTVLMTFSPSSILRFRMVLLAGNQNNLSYETWNLKFIDWFCTVKWSAGKGKGSCGADSVVWERLIVMVQVLWRYFQENALSWELIGMCLRDWSRAGIALTYCKMVVLVVWSVPFGLVLCTAGEKSLNYFFV